MTPSSDQSPLNQLNFGKLNGRQVIANFEGGKITSDAGIILMAELDQKLKITARFAECFRDYRNSSYLDYSVHQLLAQRVYGIVLGYEDVNDHDKLRHDPALAIALKKLNFIDSAQANLAGKSTINRLEYCPETVINQENSRYHKIEPNPKEIDPKNATVAIQGFGKVGYWAAIALENMGLKVVAVSDVKGGVKGFKSVTDLWDYFQANGNLNAPGTDKLTQEELLHLDVDVLIPAALADAITEKTATGIKAKIIVEGANAPTTPGGDAIINDKGILVVPDILANSGGVIVSYFEWVQDKQNYFWTAEEVKSNLNDIMMRSFKEVEEMAKSKKVSWREAAHMIGVARVAEAHRLRGLYP